MSREIHVDDPERPTIRVIEQSYVTDHDGEMVVEVEAISQRQRPAGHGGHKWQDTGHGLVARRTKR